MSTHPDPIAVFADVLPLAIAAPSFGSGATACPPNAAVTTPVEASPAHAPPASPAPLFPPAPRSAVATSARRHRWNWAFGLGLALGLAAQPSAAQELPLTSVPVVDLPGQRPSTARQSSDRHPGTSAEHALPGTVRTQAIETKPAYTQHEPDPWWQVDLRLRRNIETVVARPCMGLSNGALLPVSGPSEGFPPIACNPDYDLTGAWVLVSDLPFPSDPWSASTADDPAAPISRFQIISNGYQQPQVATVNRTARYVRIQFPPGTTRALAIELLDVHGEEELTDPVIGFSTAFDAIFPETLALFDHLSGYRDAARFTDAELARSEERGEQLGRVASTSRSIAQRIERLDANLGTAIGLLEKVEIVPSIRTPASAMAKTLETVRRSVRSLKTPAARARDAFARAESSLNGFRRDVGEARRGLFTSIVWSAGEETAVAGLYRCQVVDPDHPTQLVPQPQAAPLEGYSGFRNVQFELTRINELTRGVGVVAKGVNDGFQTVEDAAAHAIGSLSAFETALIGVEGPLDDLLAPLHAIDSALGTEVCPGCGSVDSVLQTLEDALALPGLSYLVGLVDDVLDPILGEILGPIQAVLPSVPSYPATPVLGLPDHSPLLDALTLWNDPLGALRGLLDMPSIFACAEAGGVIGEAEVTDIIWDEMNDLDADTEAGTS